MNILVISNNYPSEKVPSYGVFVYKLVQQFAKLGHKVTVIAPRAMRPLRKKGESRSYGEELAKVYRPTFLSASAKNIFGFNTYVIGEWGQILAVRKIVAKNKIEFDVVYAHFLSNAFVALRALLSYGKPVYAAVGEYNNIEVRKAYYSSDFYMSTLSKITGFIAVSPQIKEKLISFGIVESKIIMKPNGVNFSLFYKKDKEEMRKKHSLPLEKRLIIFVGRFVENKGPLKLLEATQNIDNLGLIFVGGGEQELNSEKIVFKNKVSSETVPELLSAADIFVLPTHHEGSSNAIVEAMACGLPIVSSDIPENRVQCDPSFSILVDPLNVDAIEKAISSMLSDSKKLDEMSSQASQASKKFDIKKRAESILHFIGSENS